MNEKWIDLITIHLCSFMIAVGIVGNVISVLVFLRCNRKTRKIKSNNILIMLTISNTLYLILYWYYSVLPKLILHFRGPSANLTLYSNSSTYVNATFEHAHIYSLMSRLYQINSNLFVCKLVSYLISVSIFMNASITVTFSLERALAINFPLKVRNLRENHRFVFKFVMLLVILYSFLYPMYNLFMADLVKKGRQNQRCDIPAQYESLYFDFTIMFVVQTLALPFLLISVSNVSILCAIERNRKGLLVNKFEVSSSLTESSKRDMELKSFLKSSVISKTSLKSSSFAENDKFTKSSSKVGGTRCKPFHLTRTFVAISASFVIFNLPYFVAWSRYAFFRVNNKEPFSEEQATELLHLYHIMKLTEILNLFNYAITGLLYFATGKTFRDNLWACMRCGVVKRKSY